MSSLPFLLHKSIIKKCDLLHKVLQRKITTLKVFFFPSLFDKYHGVFAPKRAFLLTLADVYIFLPVSWSDSQTIQFFFFFFYTPLPAQIELTAGPPQGQFLPCQHMLLLPSSSQLPHFLLSTSCSWAGVTMPPHPITLTVTPMLRPLVTPAETRQATGSHLHRL